MTHLALGAMGGTIAMSTSTPGEGAVPALSASDLLELTPGLADVAEISAEQLTNVPSASLTLDDVLRVHAWADARVRAGVDGIVVTHGTDTLEETAYLLDLLWGHDVPIVVTGAMRSAAMAGAEGPANLLAAAVTAASADARGLGVLACLNDTVHLAARVTKVSSTALETFESPGTGPVGVVVEDRYWPSWTPVDRLPALVAPPDGRVAVPLLESPFDDDGSVLRAVLATGVRGVVLAGTGVGHVSGEAAELVSAAIDDGVTVVVASRTLRGGTTTRLYGFPGSEQDLIARGALMAGRLSARKARLLLHLLLAGGADPATIADEIAARGR
ncbi:asparaginase [Georgenia sp. Z1344]|uniref:asparaginase n=1 Tax=Georgenia sp. Z1344 TaxID=3416706 RepID=UPI003CF48061